MTLRSLPTASGLTTLNEGCTHCYRHHTSVLEEAEDKPRIFTDRYHHQMAEVVFQIRQSCDQENVRWLVANKARKAAAVRKTRKV
jgi:hypothetical protein